MLQQCLLLLFIPYVVSGRPATTVDNVCPHVTTDDTTDKTKVQDVHWMDDRPCCVCNSAEFMESACRAGFEDDTKVAKTTVCSPCQFVAGDSDRQYYMAEERHTNRHCVKALSSCPAGTVRVAGDRRTDASCECNAGTFLNATSGTCSDHSKCGAGYGAVELGTSMADTRCQWCPDATYAPDISATQKCSPRVNNPTLEAVTTPTPAPATTPPQLVDTTLAPEPVFTPSEKGGLSGWAVVGIIVAVIVVIVVVAAVFTYKHCKSETPTTKGTQKKHTVRGGGGKDDQLIGGNDDEPCSGNDDEPCSGNDDEPCSGNDGQPCSGNDDEPCSGNDDQLNSTIQGASPTNGTANGDTYNESSLSVEMPTSDPVPSNQDSLNTGVDEPADQPEETPEQPSQRPERTISHQPSASNLDQPGSKTPKPSTSSEPLTSDVDELETSGHHSEPAYEIPVKAQPFLAPPSVNRPEDNSSESDESDETEPLLDNNKQQLDKLMHFFSSGIESTYQLYFDKVDARRVFRGGGLTEIQMNISTDSVTELLVQFLGKVRAKDPSLKFEVVVGWFRSMGYTTLAELIEQECKV